MAKELFFPLPRLVPKTLGEKMVVAGLGIDASAMLSVVILNYLESEGITNISPEIDQTIRDVLLWGAHILLSDYILKLGGLIHMRFREDENWFKHKVVPERNSIPRTGNFLVVDSPLSMNFQLEGLPRGAVPYIGNKNILKLGFLSSARFWDPAISTVFRLYPGIERELSSEYDLTGLQLKDYLVYRSKTIIDVNRQFASGTLLGHVVELPYPTRQSMQPH